MANENIDKRTPDEMLQGAYDRITYIGNMIVKKNGWDKIKYDTNSTYRFEVDRGNVYKFLKYCDTNNGVKFPANYFLLFTRVSDGALLTMTRYSLPPEKV